MDVEGQNLVAETIEAVTSEPSISYRLMLFTEDPGDKRYDWRSEDLIQMPMVKRHRLTQPLNGLRISLPEDTRKIYVGIELSQRPVNFETADIDLKTGQVPASFFEKPAEFKVTLYYRQL